MIDRIKENLFDIIVGTIAIAFVVAVFIFQAVIEGPVILRGYNKYGVVMKAEDVLKLEALEKQQNP